MKKKAKKIKRGKDGLVKKELWKPLQYVLVSGIIIIIFGFFLELILDNKVHCFCVKNQYTNCITDFYNLFVNVNSILAAIVIFFYSVQDNKKVGISNRTILTYSFGSLAVPLFFIMAMCLLPITLLLLKFNMVFVPIIILTFIFVLQMLIIVIILISTSYKFSYDIINNVEVKYYKKLCEKIYHGGKSINYLKANYGNSLNHFEQIIMSDELATIKMTLIKRLLCVPFYEKKRITIKEIYKKGNVYNCNVEKKRLKKNNLFAIYKFYYENLSGTMEYLNKNENSIERNKVYLVLYEFLEEMKDTYEKTSKSEEIKKNYLMTVSGILNAVLDSAAVDVEAFSNCVFNKCIDDMEIRRKQIGLYFLFQEYLYRTHIEKNEICEKIKLDKLLNIRDILQWTMTKKDELLYYEFWKIWMSMTTISEYNINWYFYNAIATFVGDEDTSEPIAYIMQLIKHRGRYI